MRWGYCIAIFSTVLTATQGQSCGQPAAAIRSNRRVDSGQRIIGGVEARPHSHPWCVSLQRFGAHFCGGTLIRVGNRDESDIVITAAHCVFENSRELTVVAGAHSFDYPPANQEIVPAIATVPHPQFDPDTTLNDIALVKLAVPIKFSRIIQPVCLPYPGEVVPENSEGTVAGWGYIEEGAHDTSRILMQVGVPVVNPQACQNNYRSSGIFISPKEMLCAGYPRGGKDSCQGDSGGPLTIPSGQGYVLQGVVSFGEGCARAGKPGVYARVSNYVNWIQSQVRTLSSIAD